MVDLAAGTGQLSRRFASLGARVVAVLNPPATCARSSRPTCPRRTPSPGPRRPSRSATERPTPSSGSAFHHFDAEAAFAQIRRAPSLGDLRRPGPHRHEDADTMQLGIREIDEVVDGERASSPIVEEDAPVVRAARAPRRVHAARTTFVPR